MIARVVNLMPKVGMEEELRRIGREVLVPINKGGGCLEVYFLEPCLEKGNPSFGVVSIWESQEKLDTMKKSDIYRKLIEDISPLVEDITDNLFQTSNLIEESGGFREMRRKEKLLDQEETIAILNEGDYGTLATLGKDGYPYSVPLNYAYADKAIYFHSAKEGHKVNNLRFNGKVSFSVVGSYEIFPERFDTEYDSVIIFGKVSEVVEEEEVKRGLMLLVNKYSPGYVEKGMEYIKKASASTSLFRIDLEHVTGKRGR